jgi:hypothetical protein
MTIATTERPITDHEAAQVERANASTATPVVFVHGLWLLPSSWDRWQRPSRATRPYPADCC